jgi:hypothetical protein
VSGDVPENCPKSTGSVPELVRESVPEGCARKCARDVCPKILVAFGDIFFGRMFGQASVHSLGHTFGHVSRVLFGHDFGQLAHGFRTIFRHISGRQDRPARPMACTSLARWGEGVAQTWAFSLCACCLRRVAIVACCALLLQLQFVFPLVPQRPHLPHLFSPTLLYAQTRPERRQQFKCDSQCLSVPDELSGKAKGGNCVGWPAGGTPMY